MDLYQPQTKRNEHMIYPNVQKAIDVLNNVGEDSFDMRSLDNCIAGHIQAANKPQYDHFICSALFADFTGVPESQSECVVYPECTGDMHEKVEKATLTQAIQMLKILRDTGSVRWDLLDWD
jgi:hypothetical protein